MSAYGEASVIAVRWCLASRHRDPVAAWNAAVREVFPKSESQQKKSCPRGVFLGLCEAGLVAGIPTGEYTRSRLNKDYAVKAAELLRLRPALSNDSKALWLRVIGGSGKAHNEQMDVVIALWGAGLICYKYHF